MTYRRPPYHQLDPKGREALGIYGYWLLELRKLQAHHMCEATGLPHTRSLLTKHDFTFKLSQREGNCIPNMSPHSGDKSTYIDGFPSLAAFMASDRDKTAMILKRFDRLAARNLLCLQSELAEIEARLDQFDQDDQGNRETMQSLRNWEAYKARYADEPQRMQLMARLRSTMREYSASTAVPLSLSLDLV